MRLLLLGCATLLCLATISACDSADPVIRSAEQYVRDHQKDPDATQFRNVAKCNNGVTVRGEVLGKNGYGAYAGWKKFYASSGSATVEDGGNADTMARESVDCAKSYDQWTKDIKSETDQWEHNVYAPLNQAMPQ